jgi:hypothetical protein
LSTQVHHRHDHPAQVHHPLDELRRIRDARGLFIRADLLHPQDVDPVFLRAQAESQEFGSARFLGGNAIATRKFMGSRICMHGRFFSQGDLVMTHGYRQTSLVPKPQMHAKSHDFRLLLRPPI